MKWVFNALVVIGCSVMLADTCSAQFSPRRSATTDRWEDSGSGFGGPRIRSERTVVLTKLVCVKEQEVSGDEVHLEIKVDGTKINLTHPERTRLDRIPIKKMKSGSVWHIDQPLRIRDSLDIRLWEIDMPDLGDDHDVLGTSVIWSTSTSPGVIHIRGKSGDNGVREHSYTLHYEIR
jgi:hypothetical protein